MTERQSSANRPLAKSARVTVMLLPIVLAIVGYYAGGLFARWHDTVHLADLVVAAELAARGPAGPGRAAAATARAEVPVSLMTQDEKKLEAFRSSGRNREAMLAESRRIVRRFTVGGAIFGAWCGLVAALRLGLAGRLPRRRFYEINRGDCVSCARCFDYCPRERVRRKGQSSSTIPAIERVPSRAE